MNRKTILLVLILLLLTAACEEAAPGMSAAMDTPRPEVTLTPTATEVDPVIRATLEAAQATIGAQTQTALEIAHFQAEATLAAAEIYAEEIRSQQTQIVASTAAAATAQSIQMTEAAAQITRSAESTATERAWMIMGFTATADANIATGTAQAAQAMWAIQGTQTQAAADALATQAASTQEAAVAAMNRQATLDSGAVAAASTAVAAEAVEAEAAAQRIQITNEVLAWLRVFAPILFFVAVIALGIWMWRSYTRTRIIPRDDRGAAPLVIIDGKVTVPDLMMYPMLDESADNVPVELQAAHAGNRAKVDAVRALPPRETQTGRRMVRSMANAPVAATGTSDFTILTPQDPRAATLLPPAVRTALDQQWSEGGTGDDDE